MILSELKNYLQTHRKAPLSDLANRFHADPEALRGMLNKWVDKGKVRKLDAETKCGGCCKCDSNLIEIYEWVE